MNQKTDPPLTYGFGDDFNYAVWTPNTRITLCNVPWNNDYRDVVGFDNKSALNTYIDSLENVQIENMSTLRLNRPISIPLEFNAANRYNYIRVNNPLAPVNGAVQRDYYYFILDMENINPGTTRINVQLDVWATYGIDPTTEFGNCYIARGHIGIANERAFENYGRTFLTEPEGLDIGSDYVTYANYTHTIGRPFPGWCNVLVASTIDLNAPSGDRENPLMSTARGGGFSGIPSGASFYLFESNTSFQAWLTTMTTKPWITQGIISATMIPDVRRYWPEFTFNGAGPTGAPVGRPSKDMRYSFGLTNWRSGYTQLTPSRYRRLTKLLTYPYSVVELTTWTGSPLSLKPENWDAQSADIIERGSFVPPGQRITIHPRNYNRAEGRSQQPVATDDGGDYLDQAVQIDSFPQLAIVNNMAIGVLAANAHGLAYQAQANDWAQQKAMRSNQVTYDQAAGNERAMAASGEISRRSATAMTAHQNETGATIGAINDIAGIAGGGAGGLVGGPMGAAVGGAMAAGSAAGNMITRGLQADANVRATSMGNNTQIEQQNVAMNTSMYMRDSNKGLADWAAKGDYESSVAGLNAKIQDIALTQPSVSGQFGGEASTWVHDNVEVSMRLKRIDSGRMAAIGEYWLRYGYAVNRFTVPPKNLHCMEKFTYWKMAETYLTTLNVPEAFKQTIRGIFEKGVTVWRDPNDIGRIDIADNEPLEGITL